MKILLRSRLDRSYFLEGTSWGYEAVKARRFSSSAEALAVAARFAVHDAELVMEFEFRGYDISLPLHSARRAIWMR